MVLPQDYISRANREASVALLRTCKQTYNEAFLVLFSTQDWSNGAFASAL